MCKVKSVAENYYLTAVPLSLITEDKLKCCGCMEFVDWGHSSFLQLITKKTNGIVFDIRTNSESALMQIYRDSN